MKLKLYRGLILATTIAGAVLLVIPVILGAPGLALIYLAIRMPEMLGLKYYRGDWIPLKWFTKGWGAEW